MQQLQEAYDRADAAATQQADVEARAKKAEAEARRMKQRLMHLEKQLDDLRRADPQGAASVERADPFYQIQRLNDVFDERRNAARDLELQVRKAEAALER